MAVPTPQILARIVSVMEAAHDVELERKQSNGDILVTVRLRVKMDVWQRERPDVVSDEHNYHSPHHDIDRQKRRVAVASTLMKAAADGVDIIKTVRDQTKLKAWAPQKRNARPSRGPLGDKAADRHVERWDLHDALRDEGVVSERPTKQRMIRTKCKVCRTRLDSDGACPACLSMALGADADELFRV